MIDAAKETSDLRAAVSGALEREPDVAFAYLFGSLAKGRSRRSSDVDVAIFFAGCASRLERLDRALAVEGILERETRRPVQVVVLNDAPLELARNVLGHGIPLHARDPDARREFFVEIGRRYYDFAHARQIFRAYREARIQEGRFGG